jgi:hypothetical protein
MVGSGYVGLSVCRCGGTANTAGTFESSSSIVEPDPCRGHGSPFAISSRGDAALPWGLRAHVSSHQAEMLVSSLDLGGIRKWSDGARLLIERDEGARASALRRVARVV